MTVGIKNNIIAHFLVQVILKYLDPKSFITVIQHW